MENVIPNLIVSLASYSARINTAYKAINTILEQTVKPEKIVLCLPKQDFKHLEKDLPKSILDFQKKGLEILWCDKDYRSYNKLIPTLIKYSDKIIVTVDDDIYYDKNLLKILYESYLKNKKLIHSCRSHLILFNRKGGVKKYNEWIIGYRHRLTSFKVFLTGVGGVLYPPHCFDNEVFNSDNFTKLCPTSDDIWFFAMAVYSKRKIRNIGRKSPKELKLVEDTQSKTLMQINIDQSKNDEHFKNVLMEYPIVKKRISSLFDIKYWVHRLLSKLSKLLHLLKIKK